MVRPVELQDAIAKTPAAERITQLQKAGPENDQRQSLLIASQKTQEAQHKTTPTVHPDEVILHRDRPEKDKKKRGKNEHQENRDEDGDIGDRKHPPANDEPPLPPPVLDITV
jgi:hypothetical protein